LPSKGASATEVFRRQSWPSNDQRRRDGRFPELRANGHLEVEVTSDQIAKKEEHELMCPVVVLPSSPWLPSPAPAQPWLCFLQANLA
jgi:hypothetical protein